jgi:hypothetical protein
VHKIGKGKEKEKVKVRVVNPTVFLLREQENSTERNMDISNLHMMKTGQSAHPT